MLEPSPPTKVGSNLCLFFVVYVIDDYLRLYLLRDK